MSTAEAPTLATIEVPASCKPLENALHIPLALIRPSPLNPRKRWNAAKVAEMAADLKANGQIQPIRVRHNPDHRPGDGREPYEIVVGETRYRAAPAAGLAHLDAVVADCTDQQLIQLALAENTRRQDLHPLEEADAFDALLRKPDGLQGYASVPELAAGVGVSASYVYQRLKLRSLCRPGREAFLAGQLDASVALLIARMPNVEEQARATAKIVAGFGGDPYSYRQAAEMLRREYMLRLDLAQFDTTATYGVAGPCAQCAKRSGAAPELFADLVGVGDMCQDARCYAAKGEEAHQALLQGARDAGHTVLQGAAARAVLPTPGATPIGHHRLDAPCPALTDSARTLRELLGRGFAGPLVLVDLPDALPVELVTDATARKAIKARGLLRQQTQSAAPTGHAPKAATSAAGATEQPRSRSAMDQGHAPPPPAGNTRGRGAGDVGGDAAEQRRAEDAALAAGAQRRRERFAELLFARVCERLAAVAELPVLALKLLAMDLHHDLSHEGSQLLYRARGWGLDNARHASAADFARRIGSADGREVGEVLIALLCAYELDEPCAPDDLKAARRSNTREIARSLGVEGGDLAELWRTAGTDEPVRLGPAENEADATAQWLAAQGGSAAPGGAA